MAADLIVYAIVAGVLVFWLRSILGTRNGEEKDRGNPFAPRPPSNDSYAPEPHDADHPGALPNPFVQPSAPAPMKVTKTTLVGRVKIETPMAEQGLRDIAARDSRFNLDRFIEGAEYAFEYIVTQFAKGNEDAIRPLLAPRVMNDFSRAITDRRTRGETVDTKIEAVRGMDIIAATLKGTMAFVTIRFTAQEVCIIRNAAGSIIAGDPEKTTTMIDLWTFGRDVGASDPTWHLYETRDERPEPHKTPMPESGA